MKIGLVRHFKVNHPYPTKTFLSRAEVEEWFEGYEIADLEYHHIDLCGIEWKKCISSSLDRASKTAYKIFPGEIITSDDLKELSVLPLMSKKVKLPFLVWAIAIRMKTFSSNELTNAFRKKMNAFIDEMLSNNDNDTLIVSHGFVMMFLQKELIKRGFNGDKFKTPENGKVYVFEKTAPGP